MFTNLQPHFCRWGVWLAIVTKENILWLQISVYNALAIHHLHCSSYEEIVHKSQKQNSGY